MKNADMPAMPVTFEDDTSVYFGLTKREELAARNMAAILCASPLHDVPVEYMDRNIDAAAGFAIAAADALLAKLDKEAT